jgi:ribosomal protein L31E
MTRKNIGAKLLLDQLNWILKAESITIDGIDEIKVKIRLRVWNDREDNRKEINGAKWI